MRKSKLPVAFTLLFTFISCKKGSEPDANYYVYQQLA